MANPDFGLLIGVEGEKEFKKALSDINQSFKVLGSEMQLVASQFDKNDKSAAALASRNQILNKEIEAQKDKITTLRAALENASESFGENDRRTQNWQIALNKAQAELNGMERELGQNEKALDDMGDEMDEAAENADDLGEELDDAGDAAEKSGGKFEKLGGVLKGIGAALGAVAVAAGAAAIKLGKEVIAAYADYEQLVGGVDTLFGESLKKVREYYNILSYAVQKENRQ
jgi:predicted  nucleic acid-binding Zn-ribbon protein